MRKMCARTVYRFAHHVDCWEIAFPASENLPSGTRKITVRSMMKIPRTWSRNDVGSPKSISFMNTFHIGSMFCFFPASFMSSTYTFSRFTNKHSQFGTSSQPCFNNTFSNCFSHSSDRKDFAQEERLGLPCWTMILAISVSVDVSKYLDILTLEFSITMEHLPLWPGYKRILHLLLVLRIQVVLI